MKTIRPVACFLCSILIAAVCRSQSDTFSRTEYRAFLDRTKDLTSSGLLAMHDAGTFAFSTSRDYAAAAYFDSINRVFSFTSHELELLGKHGFMVTERLSYPSIGEGLIKIYKADLPVFVSTDAILHSVHRSYDGILKMAEMYYLIPKLEALLRKMHARIGDLGETYAHIPEMRQPVEDVDLYVTVALKLLDETVLPAFIATAPKMDDIFHLIDAETPAGYKLFAETPRTMDFSQFTVRGHYTDEYQPVLARYFRSMIWLGRTEMYLIAPEGASPPPTEADIRRQAIAALLVEELIELAGAGGLVAELEDVFRFFIGESDNVTLPQLSTVADDAGLASPGDLLEPGALKTFQDMLATRPFAVQRILSQILYSNPFSPDSIKPAASFLLFGQRFVIDSYTTGAVVYDKIVHDGAKVARMLPQSLDVLFALGNDAAGQLLKSELDAYFYSPNLAAVRYLVDAYGDEFWNGTLYNAWLSGIRTLAPPADRGSLPAFMKTAAWWQEKMNTQLGSWSQLRHDNLLYAKQSYTGGITCSFPESYVEPIPEFYEAIRRYADLGKSKFDSGFVGGAAGSGLLRYFTDLGGVADTLRMISIKELAGSPLSPGEHSFLRTMLRCEVGCGPEYDGWYPRLFYRGHDDAMREEDFTIVDIHTAPTDASGAPVGWVLHGGTGPFNLGVWIADTPGGGSRAYVGPVMSYYEHLTTGFKRLTDEEWETLYMRPPSMRPDFVRLYLAGPDGGPTGSRRALLTGVHDPGDGPYPSSPALAQNYPNPFNPSTSIAYVIPAGHGNDMVRISVHDLLGRTVATLVSAIHPPGTYVTQWDGMSDRRSAAPSGVYVYSLRVGSLMETKKMILVR